MKTVAFFNNKGGVGRAALVHHLASMYADLGLNVVAADLDPEANLTRLFLDDEAIEQLWLGQSSRQTVYGALKPLLDGGGDVDAPYIEESTLGVRLILGDLALLATQNELSKHWSLCLDRNERAFRVVSAFWRMLNLAADEAQAELVLIDVGPNLGALSRSALVAADYVVVPLAPDLYSLQGLRSLGPTLRQWRSEWAERRERNPATDLEFPDSGMQPIGYVVLQDGIRLNRPFVDHAKWMDRIPGDYAEFVMARSPDADLPMDNDPQCLALLRHFRSLMPYAEEARKPMFALKSADGPVGSQIDVVRSSYRQFRALAEKVAGICGIALPT